VVIYNHTRYPHIGRHTTPLQGERSPATYPLPDSDEVKIMINTELIINMGLKHEFEPDEYLNTAKAIKNIDTLENSGCAKTVDELLMYFMGFARGMAEEQNKQAAKKERARA
jgi:hypothetical protein